MSDTYQPTDEQIEALGAYWLTEPDWQDDKFRDDWISDFRDLTASPAFQSIIRAAQVSALRDAAFSGHYGTTAQSTLLRRADRIEAADV